MTRRGGAWGATRGRRGVTLIIIALLIVVLVGMVGVALDFSRFYLYRVQLQTSADAAALAGAMEIERKSPTTAPDSALDYVALNLVDGVPATVPASAVLPGTWDFSNSTFTPAASFSTAGVNAVKVTATHSAAYTFGQVWETANLGLHTTATAAVGYVGTTDCLKPWAVAYQSLLDALYPPAGSKPVSYDLTVADIATLSQEGPANQLPLLLSPANPTAPGNIDAVQVNIPWNGNNSYKAAIDGACSDMLIGPGTWLNADPGEGAGQTKNSLKAFCDANGGTSGGGGNFTCLGAPKVKMAMWDINNGGSGAGLQFRVKYVGVFAVEHFSMIGSQITGYFSSMAASGGLTSSPSPITESVLVQ
jgi:Flp pilus assembly protein TadG